ncbi:SAC3/GANP/Nin1/mts3/eIF-3 p25 family-domain-containing protein, partial [Lineolata rhizophorae]
MIPTVGWSTLLFSRNPSANVCLFTLRRESQLKKRREAERAEGIEKGIIADPEKPRKLADAVKLVGTCQEMCPEYERVERIVQKDVWGPEADPVKLKNGGGVVAVEQRMVKKFKRAAAGLDEQLPSDLRPPGALKKTCDYLFDDLLGGAENLAKVHHFIWDRTRAIRNDFSIQQVSKLAEVQIAVDCYERIARFHILSLHKLALPDKPYDKYDWYQEREQLDKTLLSLMQYYDGTRGRMRFTNEPEFRAYSIILQIQTPIPDLEDRVQTWPQDIVLDARIQRALKLYALAANTSDPQGPIKPLTVHNIAQTNFMRFWALVRSKETSYLMACAAEVYFKIVRREALKNLWVADRRNQVQTDNWSVASMTKYLGFDNEEQTRNFVEAYSFAIGQRDDGTPFLNWGS